MKVVAKNGVKSVEGWLDPGEYHTVLAIKSTFSSGSQFLLWSKKQSTAALFLASDFEVVDETLSPLWIVKIDLNGYAELAPKEWLTEGFWELYHDGDPKAEIAFENGKSGIIGVESEGKELN